MKKYKCPQCASTASVIHYGYRKKVLRFLCRACGKHFSVNTYYLDRKELLNDHLDGISFRKLAVKYDMSKSHAWDICHEELKKLPDNNELTHTYCRRFSQILVCDGKYIHIKGYADKIPLLWGVDYLSHDIPICVLAVAENYQGWAKYFSFFRLINSYPRLIACDDSSSLKMAARNVFPSVKIQTCYITLKNTYEIHCG